MNNRTIVRICTIASVASILMGFALLLAALGPKKTSDWGAIAMGCLPQAILIVGGLLALAICSFSSRD